MQPERTKAWVGEGPSSPHAAIPPSAPSPFGGCDGLRGAHHSRSVAGHTGSGWLVGSRADGGLEAYDQAFRDRTINNPKDKARALGFDLVEPEGAV